VDQSDDDVWKTTDMGWGLPAGHEEDVQLHPGLRATPECHVLRDFDCGCSMCAHMAVSAGLCSTAGSCYCDVSYDSQRQQADPAAHTAARNPCECLAVLGGSAAGASVPWVFMLALHALQRRRYNPKGGIIITENGCAVAEEDVDEAVKDIERAVYLKRYLTRGYRGLQEIMHQHTVDDSSKLT